ncbi:ester cyclase [Lacibacter sp. H375]|uniref:ester cyclase n=1 Tax=Lacibacter sp. H375 TaxID=3133424 RepID=UPI0030BA8214
MKLLIAACLLFLNACAPKNDAAETNQTTTTNTIDTETQKNKELIKRVYVDMANKQNYALIDSFFAPGIFDHGALEGQQQGLAGFKKAVTEFLGMFSKVEITVKEIIAEGDMVATHETWTVTMKANNKVLTGETLHMFRIKDGLITDEWSKGWEWLGL